MGQKQGQIPVETEGITPTYRVALSDITSIAATATDVFTLSGAAGKIIKVNSVEITADASSAGVIDFYLYKRTAANTGGTLATTPSIAQMDSQDPLPLATPALYTANPSALGAGILISGNHYALPAAATTGYPGNPLLETFGDLNGRRLTLRGPNELFAFNLNGQAIPTGLNIYLRIEWTEE